MLTYSIILFAIAAVLGLTVAIALLRKKETSKPVAFAHGAVGALGLVLLLLHALAHPNQMLSLALGLFVVAALGGFFLLANDLRRKPGPAFLIVVHAVVAVIAFGLVLLVAKG